MQAKVGISYVSVANAVANRAADIPAFDFAATKQAAHDSWNQLLGRLQVAGGTAAQQRVFYTALYHSLLHPNVFSDRNGQYIGFDNQVHTVASGHSAHYANFSGWDIYRTQAQLTALVAPAQTSDIAQSMLADYAQGGTLPKWSQNNGETYVMVGDPGTAILASYYAFGARNFDTANGFAGDAEGSEHAEQCPAGAQRDQRAGVPAGERHLPVLQLLRPGLDAAGVRHGGLRALGVRRGARGHREPAVLRRARAELEEHLQPGHRIHAAQGRGRRLDRRLQPGERVELRRGHVVAVHRHGAVQRGGPRRGARRQRVADQLSGQRAGRLPRQRRIAGRPRQRAEPGAAVGVRLRRPAVQDAEGRAAGRRTRSGRTRRAGWPATTTSAR